MLYYLMLSLIIAALEPFETVPHARPCLCVVLCFLVKAAALPDLSSAAPREHWAVMDRKVMKPPFADSVQGACCVGGLGVDVCLDNCSLGSYSEAAVRRDSNKKALRRLSSPFQATPAYNWSHWQRLGVEGGVCVCVGGVRRTNFPLKLNPLVRGICIANWALS